MKYTSFQPLPNFCTSLVELELIFLDYNIVKVVDKYSTMICTS